LGKPGTPPADKQSAAVAQDMMILSEARDALTADIFSVPTLESAFALHAVVAPCWKRIVQALKQTPLWADYRDDRRLQLAWAIAEGMLSASEQALCQSFEALREAVIGVDVFAARQ
jgi:hypothetical protein